MPSPELINFTEFTKRVRIALEGNLPGLHFFLYPMDSHEIDGELTTGLMVQTSFLGYDIVSHLRFPGDTDVIRMPDIDRTLVDLCSTFTKAVARGPQIYANERRGMTLTFGEALLGLCYGCKVTRLGWNGKDMFLFLTPGSRITVAEGRPLAACLPVGTEVDYLPHIDMKTVDGKIVPWLCSQTDAIAMDWVLA